MARDSDVASSSEDGRGGGILISSGAKRFAPSPRLFVEK